MYQQPFVNALYGRISIVKRFLMSRFPLTGELPQQPFFVIGAARSGNTLLRAILANSEQLVIPPESYALGNIVRVWHRLNFLEWEELVRVVLGAFASHDEFYTWDLDLKELYQQLNGLPESDKNLATCLSMLFFSYRDRHQPYATRWGDKTPLNSEYLPWLNLVFPQAQYIHIVRDGRDCVASMMRAGFQDGDLQMAALEWQVRVANNLRLGGQLPENQFMEIRYEKLVTDPVQEIERVCRFLGIAFDQGMLDTGRNFNQLGDTVTLDHHRNVANPINAASLGNWRSELTATQQKELHGKLGSMLKRLGYE